MFQGIFPSLTAVLAASAVSGATEPRDALDFRMKGIDGQELDLGRWRGKVVLMVNTASKCGHTPQYAGLQKLWEEDSAKGLVVVGFPSNDFLWQEPGTNAEIRQFCSLKYRVTFPMMEKIEVKGKGQAPLYAYLTAQDTKPEGKGRISWNFEKFLIGRDGKVAARFAPGTKPEDPALVDAVRRELAKPAP
ncbi:MAG TPA: glutathione peroxidase [Fibrobacteria bacterium]|nr:glutathione peroxidase [Fibrobacteria bacterium]